LLLSFGCKRNKLEKCCLLCVFVLLTTIVMCCRTSRHRFNRTVQLVHTQFTAQNSLAQPSNPIHYRALWSTRRQCITKQSTVITIEPCFENNVELYYFGNFVSGLCWLYRFTINPLSSSPPEFLFYPVFLLSSFPNHCTIRYKIINSLAAEGVSKCNYPHPKVFQ
jgi:hypothetical protein